MTESAALLNALKDLKTGGFTVVQKLTGAQIGVLAAGGAYASGDVLGNTSPIQISLARTSTGTGIIQSVITQDLSKQSQAYDLIIFDQNPTATTFTDNAALTIADADLPKVIGHISVIASDYAAFGNNSVGTTKNVGLPIQGLTAPYSSFWVALVTRGTPTYVNSELSIAIGILQD